MTQTRLTMTPELLRSKGYPDEADRLTRARRQADLWSPEPDRRVSDNGLALSVLGSRRYDELVLALLESRP